MQLEFRHERCWLVCYSLISFPFHIFAPIVCHPKGGIPPVHLFLYSSPRYTLQAWVTKSRWAHPLWQAVIIGAIHGAREGWNQRGQAQNLPQRPSESRFLPSLALPVDPLLSSFYSPSLPAPLQREARGSERGGGIVYLTLICSVVSFGEMTGNLGGKGQLFLSLLFRGPIYRPRALLPPHLPKLQTISGWPRCCGFTHVDRG